MTKIPAILILLLFSLSSYSQTFQTFHDYKARTITGPMLEFSTFYGKKVMVVNTATYCAWTYQYEALQALYDQYKDSNFMIVGFPCNDFSNQEPGSDSTINDFCTGVYGITFQMMAKVTITHDTDQVYKWLQQADLNGVSDAQVNWNFHKFLIDEAGHWVRHFTNFTEPDDTAITNWIKSPSVLKDSVPTGVSEVTELGMAISTNMGGRMAVSFDNIGNQQAVIRLVSLNGQILSTVHNGILKDGEVIQVDTRALTNGIYFLHAATGDTSKAFKLAVSN